MRVALDTANGATSSIAPAVWRSLGASVTVINDTPDGLNINRMWVNSPRFAGSIGAPGDASAEASTGSTWGSPLTVTATAAWQ